MLLLCRVSVGWRGSAAVPFSHMTHTVTDDTEIYVIRILYLVPYRVCSVAVAVYIRMYGRV